MMDRGENTERARKCFRELFLFILGGNFFLWFQLEAETFQVGVSCPCREGKL